MNPEQFRAAVEKIIGVPADDDHDYYWQLELPGGREWEGLHIRYAGKGSKDLYFGIDRKSDFDLLMAFDQEHRPCIGENPHTGHWHIFAQDFNNDPEAVLRELARRLAKAGYSPPPIDVRDFGAKGDGVTDDTAAVQAALDAAADKGDPTECSSATGITIGILDTICTMVHLLKDRATPEAGPIGDALEDARATLQRCPLLVKPSARQEQHKADMDLIHEAAEKIRELSPGVPVSGCVIGLTEEERGHLAALMETAIEPPENRPPGFVGSVWQGQQDAWASILKKLQP